MGNITCSDCVHYIKENNYCDNWENAYIRLKNNNTDIPEICNQLEEKEKEGENN